MGNICPCCKKKEPQRRSRTVGRPPGSALTEQLTDGANAETNINAVPLAPPVDQISLDLINSLNLEPQLDQVRARIENYDKSSLKKISDDKDPFELYFDVLTDDNKDKIHTTFMRANSSMTPLAFKLANSLIPESEELKISTNYERFMTIFRGKIGNVFYIINYALYKQIMLFSKKDLFFVKAFKQLDNGDVVEITVSADHPDYLESKGIDRMKIVENVCLYKKTPEGCQVTSLNTLYPRVGASLTILKPLFSKGFRTYNKAQTEYLNTITKGETDLEADFLNFTRADDV